ncbi:HNH endonuclease [Beduinella massiliensis]|uniref:HNH endonuclease n=1 Tax=Beduinella massiliensis TaxID=1852363 RepID=UPI0031F9C2BA
MGWKERAPEIKAFYQSSLWKQTRKLYYAHAFGICESCGGTGEIVHHRIPLTQSNVHDERVAIDFANLELLCQSCHRLRHTHLSCAQDGLIFDEDGRLIEAIPPRV